MSLAIRAAVAEDMPAIARIWHDGWHEAHAAHLPQTIVAQRTLAAFTTRLQNQTVRVVGGLATPLGLCLLAKDEIDQLYVASEGRGTGLALKLFRDGETRLAAAGTQRAHLFCLLQNDRAARFYRRAGWTDAGIEDFALPAIDPPQAVPCIRFERDL